MIPFVCSHIQHLTVSLGASFPQLYKDKESMMKQVTKEAKKRLKSRKDAGNIRSSLTISTSSLAC